MKDLEFELAYYDVAGRYVSDFATETSPIVFCWGLEKLLALLILQMHRGSSCLKSKKTSWY